MLNNNFTESIQTIFNKLKNREHFSFSKYADGEFKILVNEHIINCDNWEFDPVKDQRSYDLLLDSYRYKHDDYYVGISCPCCQPMDHVQWMRDNVGTDNVTWANIFVNSNYQFFVDNFIPEFNNWEGDVILVSHESTKLKNLPFKVDYHMPIKIGAFKEPDLEYHLHKMLSIAKHANDQLFLFSAGPLGNILAYQLHMANEHNTYIDIGSTINPWTVGNNRGYLNKNQNFQKICTW